MILQLSSLVRKAADSINLERPVILQYGNLKTVQLFSGFILFKISCD